jgi:polysaccharide biosynthesis protein PslA
MGHLLLDVVAAEVADRSDLLPTSNSESVIYLDGTAVPHRHFNRRGRRKISSELIGATVACLDFLLILVTAGILFGCYFRSPERVAHQPAVYLSSALISAIIFVGIFERLRGYSLKQLQALQWQLSRVGIVWAIGVSTLLLAGFVGRVSGGYSRGWALLWFLATPISLMAARTVQYAVLARWLDVGALARRVVIVGAGDDGQRLVKQLCLHDDKSFIIAGIFDDRRSRRPSQVDGIPVLGTTDDLLDLARRESIDEVVVALPLTAAGRLEELFGKLTAIPSDLRLSVSNVAERLPIRGVDYFGATPVLNIVDRPLKQGRGLCKWLEDKLLAGLVLFFVGPLMALIVVLIKLDSRGPMFFVQPRFGFNNNVIHVLKFRTMYADKCDHTGAQRTVQDDPRVTRIGRILRSLSWDELPQLINVMRGDMSLVGPRPHAIAMKAGDRLYHQAVASYPRRHRMKPGITGWAQVNGFRGEVDTLEKASRRVEHDLYYITHWTIWLDLKILLMTVGILISRSDAY